MLKGLTTRSQPEPPLTAGWNRPGGLSAPPHPQWCLPGPRECGRGACSANCPLTAARTHRSINCPHTCSRAEIQNLLHNLKYNSKSRLLRLFKAFWLIVFSSQFINYRGTRKGINTRYLQALGQNYNIEQI